MLDFVRLSRQPPGDVRLRRRPAPAPSPPVATARCALSALPLIEPRAGRAWHLRSARELVLDQIDALEQWRRTRDPGRAAELADLPARPTREQRLDAQRRHSAREREGSALHACLDRQRRESRPSPARPRAVLAHRQPWFLDRLTAALRQRGVDVVAVLDDGADALGTAIAEQPDLLLVEGLLPNLGGLELVRAASAGTRRTRLGVQVAHSEAVRSHLEAGADLVFTPSTRPLDVALRLLDLLPDPEPAGTVPGPAAAYPRGWDDAPASALPHPAPLGA